MANDGFKVKKKLFIEPNTVATTEQGDVRVDSSDGTLRVHDGSSEKTILTSAAGVTGPASSTDNAIARFDGTTGKLIQNSGVTIDDGGKITAVGLDAGSQTVTNVATPSNDSDAATKGYVDTVAQGLDAKASVIVATTANITLSGEQTIDGVLTSASRVLVKSQTATEENGIYVSAAGAWSRATDMNTWTEVPGAFVFVEQGTTNADSGWVCTANAGGTIGVTAMTWTQFSGAGAYTADGNGIELSGTQFALELDGTTLSKGASGLKVATSGISNNEVAAAAAIARTKLASGTASHVLINDGSGVMSSEAALDETRGGTGQTTITTGDLLYGSASNTLSKLGIGSANQVLKSVSGVPAWAAAPTGGINYLSSNLDAEVDTTGWSTFADAASSTPADGTSGSPNSTWTRTTSSPLRGTGSFLWTKSSGASRQGEGVSFDFTIDAADKGKVLQGSFDYAIASGTFVDDAMSVWIYDVTNATMIQPAPYLIKNHSLAAERFNFEFQTSSSSTSYRLILYVPVSTDSANTLKFDNFNVGPQAKLYGSPVTDLTSFTPTGGWSSYTTHSGYWRRVGDKLEVIGKIVLSGAPTGSCTVNLPSGLSIDTTKLATSTQAGEPIGQAHLADAGAYSNKVGRVLYDGTATSVTVVSMRISGSNYDFEGVNATTPFTWGTSDEIHYSYTVPISGWSSSVLMSSDADTRVVAFQSYDTTGQTVNTTSAVLTFDSADVVIDTHGGANDGNDRYDVKVPGKYEVSFFATAYNAATYASIDARKNGGSDKRLGVIAVAAGVSYGGGGSVVFDCLAGDYIDIYATTGGNVIFGVKSFSVKRLSGPSQIAASETVAARYSTTANTAISTTTSTNINFADKDYDTHGAVTTGAGVWKFTAPVSGLYRVTAYVGLTAGTTAAGNVAQLNVVKNATTGETYQIGQTRIAGTNYNGETNGSVPVRLLAGEYVSITVWHNATSMALPASAPRCWASVERVGNY